MGYTTIMVDNEVKKLLDILKLHPRESYREELKRILEEYINEKEMKEIIRLSQMKKMKELWENEKDEIWETV